MTITWASGMRLLPARLNDQIAPTSAIKLANETVTSSASVQDDDDLHVVVEPDARYAVMAWLAYSSSSSTPDFRHDFFGPSGIVMERTTFAQDVGVSATAGSIQTETALTPGTDVTRGTLAGNTLSALIVGHISTVAGGTFGFRWGQATSDSAGVTLRAGSWLQLTRLA